MLEKEDIIKLTKAVYQVTGKFPENEPLKRQTREKANALLADFITFNPQIINKERISKNIDLLLAYFSVAEQQNWVNNKNFLILSREYQKIKDFFPKIAQKEVKIKGPREIPEERVKKSVRLFLNPSKRQEKIVEIAKNKGRVSLSELRSIFSEITPRTLRRDLRVLVNRGAIERIRAGKEDVLFVLPQRSIEDR